MADLVVTAANVAPLSLTGSIIKSVVLTQATTAGQLLYVVAATGYYDIADANAAGKQQCTAMCLQAGSAGQTVSALFYGEVEGFTISQNYDTQLFLSDTAGALADAAGTKSVPLGRVVALTVKETDGTLKKVVGFYPDLSAVY